jgi:PleD family two-component response regulator
VYLHYSLYMNNTCIDNSHILLVDDDSTNHVLIKSILADFNCSFFSSYNGSDALDICKDRAFDLILLDIMMEPMNGLELSYALNDIDLNKKTPRIFITARTEENIISQVYEAGALDYVKKPFHSIELKMRIITHLNLGHAIKGLEKKNNELTEAMEKIKSLQGIIPICSRCKKIRDDEGYWNMLEKYIEEHSLAEFSHSLCENCANELYGKTEWYKDD